MTPPSSPRSREERDRLANEIFNRLLDLPRSERASRLAAECSDEPELEKLIRILLKAADEATSGALALASAAVEPSPQRATPLEPGTRVGAFEVLRELGQGGMAQVYLAQRVEGGFSQQVALKVLAASSAAGAVTERFRQEREILGHLEHPSIAGIVDGGALQDGRPFFALDYVDGDPIDVYCQKKSLGLEQRVRLMAEVAKTVHFAHRNLVVHRDLKPSNLFVTHDGSVKLLDFGIAKVLRPENPSNDGPPGPAEGRDVPVTQTFVRLMTPPYASPEQVSGEPVTTASDIYQLGLMLYLLICGEPAQQIESGSWSEIEAIVCERAPKRPRDVLASRSEDVEAWPFGKIPFDLERIVLMALRKEPARRYASADALAEDLERFLLGEPVRARTDSWLYRTAKFVRRHRMAVAATSLLMALLLGAVILLVQQSLELATQRDQARLEATKASAIKDYLVGLLKDADPVETRGEDIGVRDLLDQGTPRIAQSFRDHPLIRAEVQATAGQLYQTLGLFDTAESLLEQSLESVQDLDPAARAEYQGSLAAILLDKGRTDEADELYRRALAKRKALADRRQLPTDQLDVAELQLGYGTFLLHLRRIEEAKSLFEQAHQILVERYASRRDLIARALEGLAEVHVEESDYAAADRRIRECLDIRRQILPDDHPNLLSSLSQLGLTLKHLDRLDEAEELHREVVERTTLILGDRHPYLPSALSTLAQTLKHQGRFVEAVELQERALDIRRLRLGDSHQAVAINLNDLGTLMYAQGDRKAAETYLKQALAIFEPDNPWRRVSATNLASILRRQGHHGEAIEVLSEVLAADRRQFGSTHASVALDLWELGLNHAASGRAQIARDLLEEAAAIYDEILPPDHARPAVLDAFLAGLLIDQGHLEKAESLLEAAGPIVEQRYGESRQYARVTLGLGRIALARAEWSRAAPLLEAAEKWLAGESPADSQAIADALERLEAGRKDGSPQRL